MLKPINLNKAQWELFWFGLFKIPILFFCRPKLIALDEQRVIVKIPLRRRTKNHLGTMYFGALAVGADVSGGFLAFSLARSQGYKISLAFKSFEAQFIKRPEKDVFFESFGGEQIKNMLNSAAQDGERKNEKMDIQAYCYSNNEKELVATFKLELSIKVV